MFSGWPYRKYLAGDLPKINQDAKPYRFWLLPLGLYTGARLNELCQLRVHDVIQDVHGVDLIDINDNGYNKSLKTGPSARQIPICSKLVEMGFLNFVEERRQADGNDALLFNELSFDPKHLYSRDPSRFFCGRARVQDTSVSTVRRRLMAGSILKVSVARLPFGWNGQAYLHPRSPICSAMRVVHQKSQQTITWSSH
ncbi:hypothetical protein ULE26_21360 [Stutzerimonas stutzeri]|nr:hypothetical protein ULE26_21360 [Stutzerimonas stutzeri]